jgi:hypothetical protein
MGMATVHAQFSFSIQDELGTKASMILYSTLSDATTVAQLNTEWEALAVAIDAVIGGQILGGTAALVNTPSGDEKASPAAGSRVEQTAVLDFPQTGTGRVFGVAIPSLSDDFVAGGTVVLTGDMATLITAIQGTYTASGVFASNTWIQLDDLQDAFLSFRKRRRQLSRSSYELP